jgi:hypothetical protein
VRTSRDKLLTGIASVAALLSLVFVLVNAGLVLSNQSSQTQVATRQQVINQSAELMRADQTLVRTLVTIAASTKDEALNALLARHNLNQPAAAISSAPVSGKTP